MTAGLEATLTNIKELLDTLSPHQALKAFLGKHQIFNAR
jgi:hypothetical protein